MDGALKGRGKEPPRQLGLGHSSPAGSPPQAEDWVGLTGPRTQTRAGQEEHDGSLQVRTLVSGSGCLAHCAGDSEARPEPRSIVINARICHGRGAGEHLCQG